MSAERINALAAMDDAITRLPDSEAAPLDEARAAVAELIESHRKLLAWAEAEIHNEYDGSSKLEERLAELEPYRAALARVQGEPHGH
jgi:hypothetical protein